jgi:RNase P/RNase MRP subunit p30
MLSLAGYSTAGLTLPTGLFRERVAEIEHAFVDNGVDVVLRIDLTSRSREELLRSLRRFRSAYDIVAVKCASPRVAHVSCRDSRVDLVFFDHQNPNLRLSHAMANLLRGALEVNITSTMLKSVSPAVYASISRELAIANEHKLKVVLSSGADRPEMVRSPVQIAALASTLGLYERAALDGVASAPAIIVEENAKRRSPTYVEEGVRVVSARTG